MDDLPSSLGPGHVPTWMMGFKSSTSTAFRKAPSPKPWPAQRMLWSGLGDQKRHHPGLAALPPLLAETSETGLYPGACPPSPTLVFMLVVVGIVIPTPWFFIVLINFMLQKDVSHTVWHSLWLEKWVVM